MSTAAELAIESRAWPFQEAQKIVARYNDAPKQGPIVFQTGYGPSGLPHIGTFGEVVRTTMVRRAYEFMTGAETKLICFSDDMDGLRKVPSNLPNQDMLAKYIDHPLTEIPDPFGTDDSYAAHNNRRLRDFLDGFGFEYDFYSSTECYRSGQFDTALLRVLACYDQVMKIMLPTMRPERQATYSPFLPICPSTGRVLYVPIVAHDAAAGTVAYAGQDGKHVEVPVTGGHCKLQWKPDWAMRWYALGVDYEMAGSDLIDSVKHSGRICKALGGQPPEGFNFELFRDENAEKISKSKGNGLAVEEWLAYAPPDSLALFNYQSPRKAKRLYFDVIPKTVDEYITFLDKFHTQSEQERLANPVWHIHNGRPPQETVPLSFNILMNLASVCHTEDKAVLWGFIERYVPDATPENHPILDGLVGYALAYYRDFVKPNKKFRAPTPAERAALTELVAAFGGLPADADAEAIQYEIYEIGKRHQFEPLRDWFKTLYEVLLGQTQGPRFGSFVALYGLQETTDLINRALAGEDLSAA